MNCFFYRCLFIVSMLVFTGCVPQSEIEKEENVMENEKAETEKSIVELGSDGKLIYRPDEHGNIIPDFSYCGYKGGGVALPDVKVVETLFPESGDKDDSARIKAAIDRISKRPLGIDGFRGALLLKKGVYRVKDTLEITTSGIVIKGEGQGRDGTVVRATATEKKDLFFFEGGKNFKVDEEPICTIVDDRVNSGESSFHVDKTDGQKVGDEIIVRRPGTTEWIHDNKMDAIETSDQNSRARQWKPEEYNLVFERKIKAIDGNLITLDIPLTNAFDKKYGGGEICSYSFEGRIQNVGIESLRLVSSYKHPTDEDHGWNAVNFRGVQNGWAKKITSVFFGYACVYINRGCRFITVEDCRCLDAVSVITGSRRYSFPIRGSQILMQRCYARNGRHDFVTHSRVMGPNAFVDCLAEDAHSDIGPHHRWATGTLYDNVFSQYPCGNWSQGAIIVQDRGDWGTGHGWAGAQQLFWNCDAPKIVCQKPPTAQNYAIGCIGKKSSNRYKRSDGYWFSHGKHVQPRSLYLKQLEERLGQEAVDNVTTPEQRAGKAMEKMKEEVKRNRYETLKDRELYHADFSKTESVKNWKMEGPGEIEFKDGWMQMSSPGEKGHHVFWCPEDLPESFVAEWEVKNQNPKAGLCIVFFSAKGVNGEDIFDVGLAKRDGVFEQYTKGDLNNYHISYYANAPQNKNRGKSHIRKNKGFQVVDRGPIGIAAEDTDVHKITLIKLGRRVVFLVDGQVIINWMDDGKILGKVLGGGKIGLRQMQWTNFLYRNFTAWSIKPKLEHLLPELDFQGVGKGEVLKTENGDSWKVFNGKWATSGKGLKGKSSGDCYIFREAQHADNLIFEAEMQIQEGPELCLWFKGSKKKVEMDGYSFSVNGDQVRLQRKAKSVAVNKDVKINDRKPHVLKIKCVGARIQAWLDDNPTPVIDWTDPKPLAGEGHRTLGFYLYNSMVLVQDYKVEEVKE